MKIHGELKCTFTITDLEEDLAKKYGIPVQELPTVAIGLLNAMQDDPFTVMMVKKAYQSNLKLIPQEPLNEIKS